MIHEGKEENGEKYTSVETEEEFHAALNRGKSRRADLGTRGADRVDGRGRGHRGRDRRREVRPG